MRSYIILILHALLVISSILGLINLATSDDGEKKCIERERHALLTFKQGLQDLSDMLSTWKDHPNANCCKWYGIQCNNQTGHVQRLDLHDSNYGLFGEINPSITELQHLTYLDLSNLFTGGGHIPDFIGSFPNLQYLDLSNSDYFGQIPYQIGKLSQLQHLDLSFNSLVGSIPFQLGNLSLLQSLTLQYNSDLRINNQTDWPSNLSSLRNLNLIGIPFLHNSSHHTLQFLKKLPSLKELRLRECGLSDANILGLSNFHLNFSTSLVLLDLSRNHLTSSSTIFVRHLA